MILTIDIGNTSTKLRGFAGKNTEYAFDCASSIVLFGLPSLLKPLEKKKIECCGIASVVPYLNKKWINICKMRFKINPLIINNKIKLPINIKVKNPDSLGADRISNAAAAYMRVKGRENVIAVDLGSANTFDVVLKNGDFIGGLISPGLDLLAHSLYRYTSLLPEVKIKNKPGLLIGDKTLDAIQSGIYYTFLEAVNGIIDRIKKEFKQNFKVIITGGNAKLINGEIKHKVLYIPDLVNKGICEILKYNSF